MWECCFFILCLVANNEPPDDMALLNEYVTELRERSKLYHDVHLEVKRKSPEHLGLPYDPGASESQAQEARWVFGPKRSYVRDFTQLGTDWIQQETVQRGPSFQRKSYNNENKPVQMESFQSDGETFPILEEQLAKLFKPSDLIDVLEKIKVVDGQEGTLTRFVIQEDAKQVWTYCFERYEGKFRIAVWKYDSENVHAEGSFEYGGNNALGLSRYKSILKLGKSVRNFEAEIQKLEVTPNIRQSLFHLQVEKGIQMINH